jgi:hypothetical protein
VTWVARGHHSDSPTSAEDQTDHSSDDKTKHRERLSS